MANIDIFDQRAFIREAECIGCTKCIQACPVDAILGAAKQMHTVIAAECTGCQLCIAPCPVDCIDLLPLSNVTAEENKARQQKAEQRAFNHTERLAKQAQQKAEQKAIQEKTKLQAEIQASVARVKIRRDGFQTRLYHAAEANNEPTNC